jgi:hypothetical protein
MCSCAATQASYLSYAPTQDEWARYDATASRLVEELSAALTKRDALNALHPASAVASATGACLGSLTAAVYGCIVHVCCRLTLLR